MHAWLPQVCVSQEAWQLIRSHASGHPAPDEPEGGFMIIDSIASKSEAIRVSLPSLPISRDLALLMKRYVPRAVTPKLEAGLSADAQP